MIILLWNSYMVDKEEQDDDIKLVVVKVTQSWVFHPQFLAKGLKLVYETYLVRGITEKFTK